MRRLRPIVLDVDLLPATFAARSGLDDLPRSPSRADVEWQTYAHTRTRDAGGGFEGDVAGELHPARATLPLDAQGLAITDAAFDTGANGHRIADAPTVAAASLRGWLAVELHQVAGAGSSVSYRLNDGAQDLYWTGAAWGPATDPDAHWSTRAEVQANFPQLSPAVRTLTVRARLSTSSSSPADRPAFLGFRVAYGVRDMGDEEDALIRCLLRTLVAELEPTAVARVTVEPGTGANPIELGPELGYDVADVLAVYDLTDDPDELVELAGTFTAGGRADVAGGAPSTWTPDAPIADGHTIQVEFSYRPDVVVTRHRDVVELPRLPAVLILPAGTAPSLTRTAEDHVIRNLEVDPPTGWALASPAWLEQPLEVSVIAELGSDVRRIQADLRAILQGCGYRSILSQETGRIVDVRELVPFRTGSGRLLLGVQESTSDWLIGYSVSSAADLVAVHLTRAGGVNAGTP